MVVMEKHNPAKKKENYEVIIFLFVAAKRTL